ncbi:MAG: WD40 repeat domain-containing protein [Merismopedia sp. SIO2A8]|nr:WD40 repeat domain-containing protein [Merismopedia sp. SIO2A8]
MSRVAKQSSPLNSKSKLKSNSKSAPKFDRQWSMQLEDYVTAIAWSPTDSVLAASSAAGDIVIGTSDQPLARLQDSQGISVNQLDFSGDGQFLAASGQSGYFQLWDIRHSSPLDIDLDINLSQWSLKDCPENQPNHRLNHWIDCLTWHPTLPILAIALGPVIQLWNIAERSLITQLDFDRSSIFDLAWHPQGTHLAASGHGGVSVWTTSDAANDWTNEPEFIAVPGASIAAQWSHDGRYLGSGNLDHTLTVVDWGHPPPWFMQGFPGKVRQLSWSGPLTPVGSPVIAAACWDCVTVWERESPEGGVWRNRVLKQHCQTVQAIAFQPNTFTLASASDDGDLILWRNAKSIHQILKGATQGWGAIAWAPNGHHLAAGGQTGELLLWSQSNRGKGFQ